MSDAPLSFVPKPIQFGTDGWRGTIAADFTFERVARVAPLAAQVLARSPEAPAGCRTVIVGYDRRFMAEQFAQVAAEAIAAAGFDVALSTTFAPTPLFSWLAKHQPALGAIVMTASHNPGQYLGLKVKGSFGGSVSPEVTKRIEALLAEPVPVPAATPGTITPLDPWGSAYGDTVRSLVDIGAIREAITSGRLTVFADVMHGAAAGGLAQILGVPIQEINSDRDPLFEGGAPEPLPKYISKLFAAMQAFREANPDRLSVGFVFDGDSDRIAAVDGQGNFLSSQILIPILIEHLAKHRGLSGEVVKTVSGSDLIPKVVEAFGLPLYETAVGYKYIADRMLAVPVLLGGEESGGVGYGMHIPERDALFSALLVLEAIAAANQDLSVLYRNLQTQTGFFSEYDRADLPLADMAARDRVLSTLANTPPTTIADRAVVSCQTTDGYKFRLDDGRWLMIRFSGTEPVLRLYCEAATLDQVQETLRWACDWAEAIAG